MNNKRDQKNEKFLKGFTLIESLVFMFIFALVGVVFMQTYAVGTKIILDSKNRLGATTLANQRMEVLRSLPYDAIGTKRWNGTAWVYGVPPGDVLEQEDVEVSARRYRVDTSIQYVDDAFDGTVSSATPDTVPTDYKRARITISWGKRTSSEQVVLFGNFSPEGMETATPGGTLAINVLGTNGIGVGSATVRIQNAAASIDTTTTTDASGVVILPGTPAGTSAYTITVSKAGYYGATTLPPYPTSSYNPVNIHATVVLNAVNPFSIALDPVANFTLKAVDPFDAGLAGTHFSINGGRLLGVHPNTGVQTFSLNNSSLTASSAGEYAFSNQSPGIYAFSLISPSTTKYEFFKMLPDNTSLNNTVDLAPGFSGQVKMVLLDKEIGSAKIRAINSDTGLPIEGASVRLQNTSLGYDVTGTTDKFGWTYFPQTSTPLTSGGYDITITATGYDTENDSVSIGTVLETKTIQVDPS